MHCANCDASLTADARFCGTCGASAPASSAPVASEPRCPACGTTLARDWLICPSCGAGADGTAPAVLAGPTGGARRPQAARVAPSAEPEPLPNQPLASDIPRRIAPPRSRRPLLAGAIVVAVLVIVGAALLLTRGGDGDEGDGGPPARTAAASIATAEAGNTTAEAGRPPATSQGTAPPTAASPRFAPARAAEVARSVLPAVADLPGRGWVQSDQDPDDVVQGLGDLFDPDASPSCRALARRVDTLAREVEPARAGFAGREFALEDANPEALGALVVVRVAVYRDTDGLDAALAEARAALADPAAPACIEARWSDELTAAPITPFAVAPQGGVAAAFALKARPVTPGAAPDENRSVRLEVYLWRYGNAVVQVSAAAGPSLTPGVIQAIVARTQAALERAADR